MPISVDLSVPCANAGGIEVREREGEVEVVFSPHPHGGPECLWFCFRVMRRGEAGGSPTPGAGLCLRLRNLGNMLGGRSAGLMRPVLRDAGGDWERLGPGRDDDHPDGRRDGLWRVPLPERHLDVAFCYPYGTPEVEALLRDAAGALRADAIGLSPAGRALLRLSNDYGEAGGVRPGVFAVARQHSGETPGSWVLDGFLRRIAALGREAPLVWAAPLANVDGVEQGDYGKDNFPYDLNRAWGRPPMRHETLVIQRDMARWAGRCRPGLCLDFHAPGACETGGIYMYLPDPGRFAQASRLAAPWVEPIASALGVEFAAAEFGRVASYASRWESPTFTRFAGETLGLPALSLETPYALCGSTVMTRDRYREAGRRLADAVAAALAPARKERDAP